MPDLAHEDILYLLAHMVVADGVVRIEEIDSFVKAARSLDLKNVSGARYGRRWLLTWFNENLRKIQIDARSHDALYIQGQLISRLNAVDNKPEILRHLSAISNANGRPHINENILLSLTAARWNLQIPEWQEKVA